MVQQSRSSIAGWFWVGFSQETALKLSTNMQAVSRLNKGGAVEVGIRSQTHWGDYWQALTDLPSFLTWLTSGLFPEVPYGVLHRLPECHPDITVGISLSKAVLHGSWPLSEWRAHPHGSHSLSMSEWPKWHPSHHLYCNSVARIKSLGLLCAFLIEHHPSVMWNYCCYAIITNYR